MNILVLNGRPKGEHSNSLKLTNAFRNGVTGVSPSEIKIVNAYRLNLHHCQGCFDC